ncbi:hypothetical protein GGI43DRAFT_417220 [Trichoderma evansii]
MACSHPPCSPMQLHTCTLAVPYVRERALVKEHGVCEACRFDARPGQPMAAGSWPLTGLIHVRRGYLGGMSPPMQRRMRMYKYARFFLFLDRILLQLGRTGPLHAPASTCHATPLAHEGDKELEDVGRASVEDRMVFAAA